MANTLYVCHENYLMTYVLNFLKQKSRDLIAKEVAKLPFYMRSLPLAMLQSMYKGLFMCEIYVAIFKCKISCDKL